MAAALAQRRCYSLIAIFYLCGAQGLVYYKENLTAGGPKVIELLCLIFNWILSLEYVPENFRLGFQVPLYKGKTRLLWILIAIVV